MKNPTLVIMAAGMGSRFGGLKQIEPVDDQGHIIIDFSLFDAWRAGFRDLVFIIKPEMEESFRKVIGNRMEPYFNITYVYQTIDNLPAGYSVPKGRAKPWGTGHAVLCCKDVVDGPFTVINADDFYGPSAFAFSILILWWCSLFKGRGVSCGAGFPHHHYIKSRAHCPEGRRL